MLTDPDVRHSAVVFNSSPREGRGGIWNYTLRADGAIGSTINVYANDNDAETYLLPLQRAVDYAIANLNTTINHAALPSTVLEYSYTDLTQAQFNAKIRVAFQNTIINIVAVAFFVGMVGIVYHEAGFIASERESGMSQLIEAMMPNLRRWQPQVARILSYHVAFDLIYIPGWIIIGAVLGPGLWANTSKAIVIVYHILAGLALSSWAIMGAAAFRRSQLSGITVSIVSLVLGIIAQVVVRPGTSSASIAILSLLFPPCNYVFMIIIMARFEQEELPTNLLKGAPNNWKLPGITLWVFLIIQIIVFPIIGMLIERAAHGTASKGRSVSRGQNHSAADPIPETGESVQNTVELRNFTKHYAPNWIQRRLGFFRKSPLTTVVAVDDLSLTAAKGQILVL